MLTSQKCQNNCIRSTRLRACDADEEMSGMKENLIAVTCFRFLNQWSTQLTAHISPQTQIPNGCLKWQVLLYSAFLCELADVTNDVECWPVDKNNLDVLRQNRGKWKGWQGLRIEPRTPGLCSQCSATASHWVAARWCNWGISVPPVQYIQGIMMACGYPVVVAQWQSTGCTSQVSWVQFPAILLCIKRSKSLFFTPGGKMI